MANLLRSQGRRMDAALYKQEGYRDTDVSEGAQQTILTTETDKQNIPALEVYTDGSSYLSEADGKGFSGWGYVMMREQQNTPKAQRYDAHGNHNAAQVEVKATLEALIKVDSMIKVNELKGLLQEKKILKMSDPEAKAPSLDEQIHALSSALVERKEISSLKDVYRKKGLPVGVEIKLHTDCADVIVRLANLQQYLSQFCELEGSSLRDYDRNTRKEMRQIKLWKEIGSVVKGLEGKISLNVIKVKAHQVDALCESASYDDLIAAGASRAQIGNLWADSLAKQGAEKSVKQTLYRAVNPRYSKEQRDNYLWMLEKNLQAHPRMRETAMSVLRDSDDIRLSVDDYKRILGSEGWARQRQGWEQSVEDVVVEHVGEQPLCYNTMIGTLLAVSNHIKNELHMEAACAR
ncbi:hypothetical protein [Neptuniibacter sp. QD37_11]|uniref:hypothetical protein n=1 Tax=Neptuniibacter sp. QD37_11 TaxID=3398209 RepID=UPI0039F63577